jgi:hypothetical protein
MARHEDIMGDAYEEIVGDELVGEGGDMGDEYGDDYSGDEYGDEYSGDEYGDEYAGDELGDQLVGADEIGAIRRRRRRRRRMPRQQHARRPTYRQDAIRAHKMRSSKLVVSRPYSKSRVQSIGFQSLQVPPRQSVDIPNKPQVLFRGTRLIVGSAIAPFFTIDDIKVGRSSQFVATGSQPAEAFKETSTGDNVSLDSCRPGMDIVLQVTNTSDTAQDFRAALFGDAVE